MEPPIMISSISVDLAKAPDDGIDSGKCKHFSIRGFVDEIRQKDHRKCWPFSEDSVELRNHESYSLPCLSVVKSRWWRCASCIKDINAKKINDSDCGLQSHSRSVEETKLNVGSSAVPSRRKLNWLSVSDKKTKKKTTATLLKKVRRRANSKDASTTKSKTGKLASPKQVKKRSKESREMVHGIEAFGSCEIAGVVDDTPPDKATKKNDIHSHVLDECDNNNVSPQSRKLRKTRRVRLLSELLSAKSKETPSKTEYSSRGRKRKSYGDEDCTSAEMTNYASRILSTMGNKTSYDHTVSGEESIPSGESQSTDSGFNKEGKQRDSSRLMVVEAETAQVNHVLSSFPSKELMAPCPLHTQRTEKEISLDKKRKRKAPITDYTKSTTITFSNNMDALPQPCPRDTVPQSTRDFLNSKWLDSSFDRDGHLNKFPSQFNGWPLFPLPLKDTMHYKECDGAVLKGTLGTNHLRNFGSSFNSTNADACLRTGVNVNFSSNIDTIRPSLLLTHKLRHTSSTEVPYGSCSLQKDISTAHGKGKASEHIDDIPMEIVELMAKNQYERCLPDREEDKQPSQATTSVSKNPLLIDLNETYDNSMDNNNTTRQPKPLVKNAWNSDAAVTKEGQFMSERQWISIVPFGVGNSPPSLDNQSSSIQFSRPNTQWTSSVPATMASQQNPFRVLRACNTCQSVQQQQNREASPHPVWVSPLPAHNPVSLNMQKFMDDQSTKLENPNSRNFNFTHNGKQKLGFEGVGNRPLDTYANESSIPAMHLLSLMDPRLSSNVPVDQSRNTSFAKPPVHQSQPGDCNKTAKQWPFDLYSKRVVTPETSSGNIAIIPPVGTSSISFQSEKAPADNADFRFQASWNHHQEKNSKRKDNDIAPLYNNGSHQKPVFTSNSSDPGKFQLLGASDSMKLPLKYHMKDNAKKHRPKNHNNATVSACPPTSTCGRFVCSVSRNPADFTFPDAPGNIYMIKGEDLKVSKQPSFRKKQNLCKQDALMQNKTSFALPDAECLK
ncbi:hypothetical protein HA466_0156260 [Hirschfeldia incana]|nr:hypothetical protein HA466_0156260 [Hirschfeldia incana]KAJ0248542.1 hypothetical protein HA466_0156260 [Hirschfeldia incana]